MFNQLTFIIDECFMKETSNDHLLGWLEQRNS